MKYSLLCYIFIKREGQTGAEDMRQLDAIFLPILVS
jgi:hypothetical protein